MAETLGTFEHAVLLAIVRLKEDAYGRAILKEVQDRLGRDVAAGAVHATLERLERRKLVASRVGQGTPIRDGRPRRFYRIEPSGLEALNNAREGGYISRPPADYDSSSIAQSDDHCGDRRRKRWKTVPVIFQAAMKMYLSLI
jgi:PadR family transcriptional regulator PadR